MQSKTEGITCIFKYGFISKLNYTIYALYVDCMPKVMKLARTNEDTSDKCENAWKFEFCSQIF